MDKDEFRIAVKRNGLSCDEFAILCGRTLRSIYSFGETAPVPFYARLILRLLDERGGSHGLIRRSECQNTKKLHKNMKKRHT